MNKEALFCDGTGEYVLPPEPDQYQNVCFRFRTAKDDIDGVCFVTGNIEYPMTKIYGNEIFDYYEIKWCLQEAPLPYYFRINKGSESCYFNRYGVVDHPVEEYDFKIVPGFSTPQWSKGAVMYQIFPDRFCNGEPGNDVEDGEYIYLNEKTVRVKDWYQYPAPTMGIREFYGGDLQGVWSKLDYLQELGVEVLYFNPMFVSPSNHKYDTQDYDHIDPHLSAIAEDGGQVLRESDTDNHNATKYQKRTTDKKNLEASDAYFAAFVKEVHSRGMKVILDGVFNHCGSFNKWMDREKVYDGQEGYEKGAYLSADSPYVDFFHFTDKDPAKWPDNGNYEGWWGHPTLPKLNYEGSEKLKEYILHVGKKWVSKPYCVDGWRLDVAADLGVSKEYNHQFWKEFRRVVKEANPNALILAEHYGDPSEWLQGDEWDSVMNYDAFMEPVTWFLTGMEKHSDGERLDLCGNGDYFRSSIQHHMSKMLMPSLQSAMNELSNHDHSRFLTRTNHMVGRVDQLGHEAAQAYVNPAVMRCAVVIQMTWIGAPTIYYGDEAGLCGFTDPDNRRTYPWGREDKLMLSFHKEMIRIHKNYQAFRTGSLKLLLCEDNLLAYARFQGEKQFVVIVNSSDELREVTVPVWSAQIPMEALMSRVMYTYEGGYVADNEEYLVQNGEVVLNMGAYSAIVLKRREY